MKLQIKDSLDNPTELEKMYRNDKAAFKRAFDVVYPEIRETATAQVWNARLNHGIGEISWGTGRETAFVLALCLVAGLAAKIPDLAAINPEYFYPRNIAFVVFPALAAYFAWKHEVRTKAIAAISAAFVFSAAYINLLPDNAQSDTLVLACIHLPLFLWAVLGFAFAGGQPGSSHRRLDFLRYNADLLVMTTVMGIAGTLLTGITFGLFGVLGIRLEEFYFRHIAVWGLAAAPVVATYLVRTNPQLVGRVSPVIARIFTPLVLAMLVVYLAALVFTGKNPYNDREFLLVFNLLLAGVMSIIFFSVSETRPDAGGKIGTALLFALSVVTIIVNGIALSAIGFRIFEGGITPNRLAVSGGNVLILANLLVVAYRLFKTLKGGGKIGGVADSIAFFLPVYGLWAVFVTFLVPVLFGFK